VAPAPTPVVAPQLQTPTPAAQAAAAASQAKSQAEALQEAERAAQQQAAAEAKANRKPGKAASFKTAPLFQPLQGPALPISADKQQRLNELLRKYQVDEITPEQYHQQRASILAGP